LTVSSLPDLPPPSAWRALVGLALAEDLGPGDVTSAVTIPSEAVGRAQIEARQDLVVCGLALAAETFLQVDPRLDFEVLRRDADRATSGDPLAYVTGSLRSILAGERTALNFVARMCGVASFTRRHVDAVAGTGASVTDTRKTLPGWRALDKYAVAVGGGTNHRTGLYDGVLLKDNHIAATGDVATAVKAARASAPAGLRVQVEVQSLGEADEACRAGADFLLLDNCSPEQVREIVDRHGERALLEASGGIHLGNLRRYAETGVRRISIGALTHSAPAADVALELLPATSQSGPAAGRAS
jgi:nicotinate-nucleotide pyrophosphorylase (carboxylating)